MDDWFDLRTDGEQQGPPAISMLELQAAIDAAAPPPLAPRGPLASPPSSPLRTSTPLPLESALEPALEPTLEPALEGPDMTESAVLAVATPVRKERKRRRSVSKIDDIFEGVKLTISEGKCVYGWK